MTNGIHFYRALIGLFFAGLFACEPHHSGDWILAVAAAWQGYQIR